MYNPLSVRSVAICLPLAAELKTSRCFAARHGFHFRATIVFCYVATHSTEVVQSLDFNSLTCRISADTIFVTAQHEPTNGIIGVNGKGQVSDLFRVIIFVIFVIINGSIGVTSDWYSSPVGPSGTSVTPCPGALRVDGRGERGALHPGHNDNDLALRMAVR